MRDLSELNHDLLTIRGGNDFPARVDFDGAGAVSIFLEDKEDDEKPSVTEISPRMTMAIGTSNGAPLS